MGLMVTGTILQVERGSEVWVLGPYDQGRPACRGVEGATGHLLQVASLVASDSGLPLRSPIYQLIHSLAVSYLSLRCANHP